uniref:Uncharacterized protein n=1 Tax=Lygus hesperus TaxID=30085 RepID=A0A146LA53_LYGHE
MPQTAVMYRPITISAGTHAQLLRLSPYFSKKFVHIETGKTSHKHNVSRPSSMVMANATTMHTLAIPTSAPSPGCSVPHSLLSSTPGYKSTSSSSHPCARLNHSISCQAT